MESLSCKSPCAVSPSHRTDSDMIVHANGTRGWLSNRVWRGLDNVIGQFQITRSASLTHGDMSRCSAIGLQEACLECETYQLMQVDRSQFVTGIARWSQTPLLRSDMLRSAWGFNNVSPTTSTSATSLRGLRLQEDDAYRRSIKQNPECSLAVAAATSWQVSKLEVHGFAQRGSPFTGDGLVVYRPT